jgi:hypothetical protein
VQAATAATVEMQRLLARPVATEESVAGPVSVHARALVATVVLVVMVAPVMQPPQAALGVAVELAVWELRLADRVELAALAAWAWTLQQSKRAQVQRVTTGAAAELAATVALAELLLFPKVSAVPVA